MAIALALLALVVVALAVVEVLVASAPEPATSSEWTSPLERADEALRAGDIARALVSWRRARVSALRSGGWEEMIEVGDAARRLGADPAAREAYLTALMRARRQRSLEGVLRAAAAFGELGDRDVVAQALRIAERQAAEEPHGRERVRAVADRWMTPLEAGHRQPIPGGLQ